MPKPRLFDRLCVCWLASPAVVAMGRYRQWADAGGHGWLRPTGNVPMGRLLGYPPSKKRDRHFPVLREGPFLRPAPHAWSARRDPDRAPGGTTIRSLARPVEPALSVERRCRAGHEHPRGGARPRTAWRSSCPGCSKCRTVTRPAAVTSGRARFIRHGSCDASRERGLS